MSIDTIPRSVRGRYKKHCGYKITKAMNGTTPIARITLPQNVVAQFNENVYFHIDTVGNSIILSPLKYKHECNR